MTSEPHAGNSFAHDISGPVVARARELVERLVKQSGRETPPFLARDLAQLQGISRIVKADIGEMDGILLTLRDGYEIRVNKNHSYVRQNFSCAHELGHVFMHQIEREGIEVNAEFRALSPFGHPRMRERICDAAAAEMLMPERIFRKYLSRYGVSVNSIEWLAHTFAVSIETAAIRIAEVSEEPCIAMKWKFWQRTRSIALRLVRRVGPGKEPLGKSRIVTEQVYVKSSSPLFKAYGEESCVKTFRQFTIGGAEKRCYLEAKGFGHGNNRYVISLAFPNR